MTEKDYAKGLEGVIAAESEICQIDGAGGKLFYRGYSIEDLAKHSSFEETAYLLLNEKLPSELELKDFTERMRQSRDLSQGANFLYQLKGEEPSPEEGRILDICLLLHAEHGFNASTFTARVVASTYSTCYCSISAAIGALAGFLHGGANERVMNMVDEIGSKENIEPWLDKALSEHRKVMGMGHRVYKAKDPRATVMERMLQDLSQKRGDLRLYEFLKQLEESFRARMEKKGKPIYPNVDFFSGAVYTMLGIPRYLFTPLFAAARSAGWLAHILEQRKDNRIFRLKALFVGPDPRPYVPLEKRSSSVDSSIGHDSNV